MDDDKVVDSGVLGNAPKLAAYRLVICPERVEIRSSLLCESVCANTAWSDDKADEVRRECPVWRELQRGDPVEYSVRELDHEPEVPETKDEQFDLIKRLAES